MCLPSFLHSPTPTRTNEYRCSTATRKTQRIKRRWERERQSALVGEGQGLAGKGLALRSGAKARSQSFSFILAVVHKFVNGSQIKDDT